VPGNTKRKTINATSWGVRLSRARIAYTTTISAPTAKGTILQNVMHALRNRRNFRRLQRKRQAGGRESEEETWSEAKKIQNTKWRPRPQKKQKRK
jgi:hypothetical protein